MTPSIGQCPTQSLNLTIILILINSDEQAIGINKDTDYGQSGAVHTNSMSVDDEPSIPRGGI